jgi:glycerophosphoryl diester phosphodiesterase
MKRVGHKGADKIAPGNTSESFDAALAAGVDMIEFDVLPEREGEGEGLILAHDYRDAAKRTPLTLEQGLAHLARPAFDGLELDVDLKLPGYEARVVAALGAHGLLSRSLITSQYRESLAAVKAADPSARVGWSVPRARHDYTASKLTILPALVLLVAGRTALPTLAARAIRAGKTDAIMSHWRLVTPRLVRAVGRAGGELYVWTVDDLPAIERLVALGVDGVITNDPRLFGRLQPA